MNEDYIHKLGQLMTEFATATSAEESLAFENLQTSREFWGGEWTYEEQDAIRDEFRANWNRIAARIAEEWGKPAYQGQTERSPFPSVPAGHEIAYWLRDDCLLGVFWDHQDKELPYTLELIACGPAALQRFSAS